MTRWLADARKFAVAVAGVLGLVLSAGLIGGTARTIVVSVLGFLTAVGVYVVPNSSAPAAVAPPPPPPAKPAA